MTGGEQSTKNLECVDSERVKRGDDTLVQSTDPVRNLSFVGTCEATGFVCYWRGASHVIQTEAQGKKLKQASKEVRTIVKDTQPRERRMWCDRQEPPLEMLVSATVQMP